jgi:hypothetical protein
VGKIYHLTNEAAVARAAVGFFWENVSAKADCNWGRRVHVEFNSGGMIKKCPGGLSARALLYHGPEILAIGSANDGKGSGLVLRQHERGGRSIIFTVFLPISWFLLLLNDLSDWYKHGHKELDLGILTLGLASIFLFRL